MDVRPQTDSCTHRVNLLRNEVEERKSSSAGLIK